MNTASVEYQTSADKRTEFDACGVHLCQHFRNAWSLAPPSANITAPPADAHRRSLGTHRRLPQQSVAIGRNTASRHTRTHYFPKNHLIFSHLPPGFPRGPLPSRRPTNTQDISSLPFVLHTLKSFSVVVTFADAYK
jgi:hypothetical protein